MLGLAALALCVVSKTRGWGILASAVVLFVGYLSLFGWTSSPSIETTGQVLDKDYYIMVGPIGQTGYVYKVRVGFDGISKSVRVNEGMYDSMNRDDEVVVCYCTEKWVFGLKEHIVVESIDIQRPWSGGGRSLGAPGGNQFKDWGQAVLYPTPLLLMTVGLMYSRYKRQMEKEKQE